MSTSLNLVTGYRGQAHITSDDVAALNQVLFGDGAAVFDVGSAFAYDMPDATTFRIADGEAIIQGRHVRLSVGDYASVSLLTPEAGYNRKDYITLMYAKSGDGEESVALALQTGTATTGTAALPTLKQDDTTQFDSLYHFPLYSLEWSGAELKAVTQVFTPLKIIPAQLAAKQDTITGAASTVTNKNLTAGRVLGTDSSGKIGVSDITSTELGYLDGAKSNIQTQINTITTMLKGIGRWYFSASEANLASDWDLSLKKFDTATNVSSKAGNLTSSIKNGYWIPPKEGFFVAASVVTFSNNTTGSRFVRLNIVNSKNAVQDTIASNIVDAPPHTMNLSLAGCGFIGSGEKLGLYVAQDSGKTVAVKANIRILFIPNI